MKQLKGFTLVELLITLTLIGIIAALVVPSFYHMVRRYQSQVTANTLIQNIQLARDTAISKGTYVTLCPSNNLTSCNNNWSNGWITFIDHDKDGELNGNDEVIRVVNNLPMPADIQWNSFQSLTYLMFIPQGITNYQNGNFTLCPTDHDIRFAQQIVLNVAGRSYLRVDSNHDGIIDDGYNNISCPS